MTRRPTYEGRPLPRPDEEVVDQGLAFDLGTLSRRSVLKFLGLGAATAGLTACGAAGVAGGGSSSSSTTSSSSSSSSAAATGTTTAAESEIPEETAGPYPGDGSNGPDVLETSGVVRRDITTSFGEMSGTAEGVPVTVTLALTDLASGDVPFEGVAVYVWHCDREGRYSLYSDGVTEQNYLRGVQVADSNGEVTFTSIFPACYDGRWPHIHFEVYPDVDSITDSTSAIATSQIAMVQDVCDTVYATEGYEQSVTNLAKVSLDGDNVFGDDGGVSQLPTVTGDVSSGYTMRLAVGVDTSTAAGGGAGGDGGGMGAPPTGGPGQN
ncbi:dioxygenase family protein [Jatrophihabitans sp. YIM 134969]